MRQGALRQIVLPADTEHDLEIKTTANLGKSRPSEKLEEFISFIGAGRHPERFQGEAGIPHPRKAIVPITLASDCLR